MASTFLVTDGSRPVTHQHRFGGFALRYFPAHYDSMAAQFTPDAFYESAHEFAGTALRAHHARQYRRAALDAGMVLEHLAKACLARRSPALLTELKDERSFSSLLSLLGFSGGKSLQEVRTVSLRNALQRVKRLVVSDASESDLEMLVDMRDGTVHAAADEQVGERILIAFIQHVDVLLDDLERDRTIFWGDHLVVVDKLLEVADDKVAQHVGVKLASARAYLHAMYGKRVEAVLQVLRMSPETRLLDPEQQMAVCPVCGLMGVMTGDRVQGWEAEDAGIADMVYGVYRAVWFHAQNFICHVCMLHLESVAELKAAGIDARVRLSYDEIIDFNRPLTEEGFQEWLADHPEADE
jgi:hypothetical protein